MIGSYSEIYNVGHKALDGFFSGLVNVEEKLDGSQFSFGMFDDCLKIRSKRCDINPADPDGMFAPAVEGVKRISGKLAKGAVYRAEAVCRPRHNVLCYNRAPELGFVVFDIEEAQGQRFMAPIARQEECDRIGAECIRLIAGGVTIGSATEFSGYLENESMLGGPKVEGVVCKPCGYDVFEPRSKKVLMAKYVSEAFREKHEKAGNPNGRAPGKDVIQMIAERFRTEARWQKARQHLSEDGRLQMAPQDIPLLLKEAADDIEKEEADEIKKMLWEWAWPQLRRSVVNGLPEWWKGVLLETQFDK